MSCCGRGTTTPGGRGGGPARTPARRQGHGGRGPAPAVYFQYVGTSRLTVYGPVSGRSYRFETPGAVLPVDPRDRRSLAAVPMLCRAAGRVVDRAKP